jgi:hypothetical protein
VHLATFQYYLKEQVDKVTAEIIDAQGQTVATLEGTEPEREAGEPGGFRGGPPSTSPTTAAGLNQFQWNQRYPGVTSFEGMIFWSARPQQGPKAPPGQYQVRITAGQEMQSKSFEIELDPRLKGVTAADLQAQFELASKIRDRTSAANEAVIQIRDIQKQAKERLDGSSDRRLQETADTFLETIGAIEEELYQVRNRSGQDPLNFPIKLNNRLASLRRSIENGDAKPTDGAYKVYEELSAALDQHLEELHTAIRDDLPRLNELLSAQDLEPIEVRGPESQSR